MIKFLLSMLFWAIAASLHAERPNILFIYTDDQGAWTVGDSGNEQAHTPNIDRIYNEGVVFKNAFVHSPVCSPARATLLTSRHGSEQMILDWIRPGGENWLGCDPNLPTWPRTLQKSGYRTALIGKWHLGIPDKFHPSHFGYETFMGHRAGGWPAAKPTLEKNGKAQKFEGLTEDILATETIEYITKHKKATWLVSLHFRAPHTAWLPVQPEDAAPHQKTFPNFKVPHPDLPDFNHAKFQANTRDYYSSVSCVDRNVGRILDHLEKLGIDEKTLIIFTSDHGYNVGHYGLWSKGNAQKQYIPPGPQTYANFKPKQRPNLYDTSIRVPCALRWRGKIEGGRVLDDFVMNSDWFATLCEAANTEAPTDIRGRSFWPQVTGKTVPDWENTWYGEWDMRAGARIQMRSIRTERWKLAIDFLNEDAEGNRRAELYDLKKDPEERRNLFNHPEYKQIQTQLTRQLVGKMREVDPPQNDKLAMNINFASASAYDLIPPGKIAGVVPSGMWNNYNTTMAESRGRISALFNSEGEATTCSLVTQPAAMLSNNKQSNRTLLDANQLLLQGWAGYRTEDDSSLVLENIPKRFLQSGYDVLIYGASDAPRKMTYQIGEVRKILQEAATPYQATEALVEGTHYVRFENQKASTLRIEASANEGRAAINAIQVIAR